MRSRQTAAAVAVLTLAGVTACSGTGGTGQRTPLPATPAPATVMSGAAAPDTITTGLDAPWSIVFFEGVPLVSERDSSRILELDGEGTSREVGTVADAAGRGEGGLLGIAVRDGFLYAYLTAGEGNRIERRELVGTAGSLQLGPPDTVLDGIPAGPVHNGGRIAFGPDGMLYATTGDAGNRASAQDLESVSGKILRMTPEGAAPGDNPFPGSLVYSYGHRNPQGIAWDANGVLYATEFGQDTWDELNVIVPGQNYGWPEAEGITGEAGFTDPVQQWTPDDASPSGMAVSNGYAYIANLRGQRMRRVPLSDPGSSAEYFAGEYGRLRDVVNAPDGSLWVLTNNTDGRGSPGPDDDRVLRLEPEG
ncbi:PQQ-dependent sugar dehydrogenase [Arthrobacter sp. zg-Y750]|uniref:PQQ-dependent sugar dehydrogenase n=1 Tax=Arthrobacter sp. zg-Y750 TaxID=2894189 RepID=UPI001E3C402D|nr:PQQ-dependent sugar dehydrogenase [Arthrobacter sp. zg-Y750]MCC9178123.1 PQQ-dependent sugar dehydrogenase [Arthrobacter sp. zg-Y750]